MKKNSVAIGYALLLISCNKADEKVQNCITYEPSFVTKFTMPDTLLINQSVNIPIEFQCSNGCGNFGSIVETNVGNTKTLKLTTKYEGCICTQDVPTRTYNYTYNANNTGVKYVKVYTNATQFILDSIFIK